MNHWFGFWCVTVEYNAKEFLTVGIGFLATNVLLSVKDLFNLVTIFF